MQVVSGGYGGEQVHFVAPSAETLSDELDNFLSWFNTSANEQDNIDLAINLYHVKVGQRTAINSY